MTVPRHDAGEAAQVLIVDDNQVNCILLKRKLEAAGHRVTVASSGREALDLVDGATFDLVLLDVMMPEMSGLEVLETVRRRFGVAELPVIMATAADESADIVDALGRGANDYVTKPFDFPIVLARVSTQLLLRRAMVENRRLLGDLEVRNRFIREVFGRYVDDGIVSRLLETQDALSIGGEKRRVTVLMADLRGFTTVAEALPPESVVRIINNFLTVMTDVIMECGGTIDEFIGDAILVLFGAPVQRADHARAAATCAIRMQVAIEEVNRRNSEMGFPSVEMGVGINTGEVVVGNIGSERRTKYGVVGKAVNLASRIESYTVGGQILISESTRAEAGDDLAVEATVEVHPKGSAGPITLHRIRGIGALAAASESDSTLMLSTRLSVGFTVMEGKDAGGALVEAWIVGLSPREALVASGSPPPAFADVRLRLWDETLYGKVTESGPWFRVRFTSIPPDAGEKIRRVLGH